MRKLLLLVSCTIILASCTNLNEGNNKNTDEKTSSAVNIQNSDNQSIEMIIKDTADASGYIKRAEFYLAEQQIGNAMRDINTALSIDSKNVDALLILSDIYYSLGDLDNIMLTLNKATEVAPYDSRPVIKLAELSFLQGNVRMADACVDKALQINRINPQAYYMRGIINLSNNDTTQALKNFNIARSQDDNFFDPIVQIAAIYAAQHNDMALDFYDLAYTLQPDNWSLPYEKALYLQDNGRPEEAIAIYDTILKNLPDNYDVIYNKGYVNLVYLLDYDMAIKYFDEALSIKPGSINALLNKGIAYEQKGNFTEAKSIYLQILRDNPNYQLAIDALRRIGE